MSKILEELEAIVGQGRIRQQEILAQHTVNQAGGPAELYIEISRLDELIRLVQVVREIGAPLTVFGTGSKVIFPDDGLQGLVIKNNCRHFDKASLRGTIRDNKIGFGETLIYAESGTNMNQLVRYTIDEGLEGLEYHLGTPGTVGGCLFANVKYAPKNVYARSYMHMMKILDKDGQVQAFTKELPYFVALDDSFETEEVILSVTFKLLPADKKLLWERGKEAVEFRSK